LKIAQRINAVVLSNDSFQEFHEEYRGCSTPIDSSWQASEGRGWVFTPRIPCGGQIRARGEEALAHPARWCNADHRHDTDTAQGGQGGEGPQEVAKAVKVPTKTTKKTPKVADLAPKHIDVAPKKIAKKTTRQRSGTQGAHPVKKVLKAASVVSKKKPAERRWRFAGPPSSEPESDFSSFKNAHKIGSKFEGEVTAFTSHGPSSGEVTRRQIRGVLRPHYVARTPRRREHETS